MIAGQCRLASLDVIWLLISSTGLNTIILRVKQGAQIIYRAVYRLFRDIIFAIGV